MSTNLTSFTFLVSSTDRGTFVATSTKSPFFCLEADTEESVTDLASRALTFFTGYAGTVTNREPRRTPAMNRALVRSERPRQHTVLLPAVA